jgi:hypothetical protein
MAAPPPPLEEALHLREEVDHEARVGLALGIGFFAIGEALALGHALDAHSAGSLYELTPVVGPAVGLFREQPDTAWATALVFSSWFEAAGIVVLAAAASYLSTTHHLQVEASIDRNGDGSLGLRGRF